MESLSITQTQDSDDVPLGSGTDKTIILVSGDDCKHEISLEVAKAMSGMVKCMTEDDDDDSDDGRTHDDDDDEAAPKEFSFPKVRGEVLGRIVEYCRHYHRYGNDPKPEIQPPFQTCELDEIVSPWYVDWLAACTFEQLRELVSAANYLDVQPLLDLCVLGVASEIKGKTADEVRPLFGLQDEKRVFALDGRSSSSSSSSSTVEETATDPQETNNLWCKRYMEATTTIPAGGQDAS